MIWEGDIVGKNIYLRSLGKKDISDRYADWLADPEVNRTLETRWKAHSHQDILDFVKHANGSNNSYLFGIFFQENDAHIGNIKIGPINPYHAYADISFFIGEKEMWSKGFSTEAVALCVDFSFQQLNLNRVQAGYISGNVGSAKVFERNGFSIEGYRRQHNKGADGYSDTVMVALLRNEWQRAK